MSNVTAVPIKPTKRSVIVWLVLGLLLAVAAGAWLATKSTGQVVAERGTNAQFLAWNKTQSGVVETASGLQYQVMKPGAGPLASDQLVPIVAYRGQLRDGSVFDQSKQPMPMPPGRMTPGFGEALKLMRKGSVYRLWVKPELAYGAQSPDPSVIPPNALLIFDVAVVETVPEQVLMQQMMQQMMRQQQGGAGLPVGAAAEPSTKG